MICFDLAICNINHNITVRNYTSAIICHRKPKNHIKSFILSLEHHIYTIVHGVEIYTLLQISYTERGFQKNRAYRTGLPSFKNHSNIAGSFMSKMSLCMRVRLNNLEASDLNWQDRLSVLTSLFAYKVSFSLS